MCSSFSLHWFAGEFSPVSLCSKDPVVEQVERRKTIPRK